MNGLKAVFKRELRGYFSTPLAYVFLVIFLSLAGYLAFKNGFFEARQADLRTFFVNMPMLFIFLVPAMAMRLWAEERRNGTIELLFTLPITPTQAVLGKFLASWAVIALALVLTAPIVVTICYLGNPDPGPIAAGYLGSLLLAGSYLAIGSFFSSLSSNQVIAFVLGVLACAAFIVAGNPSTLSFLSAWLPAGMLDTLEGFSFQNRFESIERGVLQLKDILFFALLAAGWLWANILAIEERKAAA